MYCPHGCTSKQFAFNDCINEPDAVPDEGSCGICYNCGGWWEIKGGMVVRYIPTVAELELVMSEMAASRERFRKKEESS